MRSPSAMQIIDLDITNACHLSCSNCTRSVGLKPKPYEMTVDQFEKAVDSMDGWKGHTLAVLGGEPTLHRNFAELSRSFQSMWGPPADPAQGVLPIQDFNSFAQDRLCDNRTGRGLWTSLGPGYARHYELIQEVYSRQTINTHDVGGRHQSGMFTRKELGIPDEVWYPLRDACWIQNMWSASVNPHGAYFCEFAGTLDHLYFDGKHAWPVEKDWWRRTPEEFGAQLELCELCGHCLKGPSAVDNAEVDQVSPVHAKMLEDRGMGKKNPLEIIDPSSIQWDGRNPSIQWYLPESNVRVPSDHSSLKAKNVAAVVVCVNYSDKLAKTIEHNAKLVDQLVVVTTMNDYETKRVVGMCSVPVTLVISDRCYDNSFAFNKGAMINDGLAAIRNPDWVILTDADVFLNSRLRRFFDKHVLNPGVLYYTDRFDLMDDAAVNKFVKTGDFDPVQQYEIISSEPNGYFQLFNKRAAALEGQWPNILSESFCSAAGVDTMFQYKWPVEKGVLVSGIPVHHIAHSQRLGENWNGIGMSGAPRWKQLGILTYKGVYGIIPDMPEQCRMKLTSTKDGKSVEVDWNLLDGSLPREIVRVKGENLIFLEEDIGLHHIHLAYWVE